MKYKEEPRYVWWLVWWHVWWQYLLDDTYIRIAFHCIHFYNNIHNHQGASYFFCIFHQMHQNTWHYWGMELNCKLQGWFLGYQKIDDVKLLGMFYCFDSLFIYCRSLPPLDHWKLLEELLSLYFCPFWNAALQGITTCDAENVFEFSKHCPGNFYQVIFTGAIGGNCFRSKFPMCTRQFSLVSSGLQ